MLAPLAKFIDWYATQYIWTIKHTRAMLKSAPGWTFDATKSKLDEAVEFLNGPDFIPAESKPVQLEFHGTKHFTFLRPL